MKARIALATSVLGLFLLATPILAQTAKPTGAPPFKRGLTETKLRSCEARQDAVKNQMSSLIKLSTNIVEKFDAIATRVQEFYTNKVLPTGKTVPNYDSLVADIAAKKAIVTTDLASAQTKVSAFSCTGDDPKGLLTQFRLDMQKVKNDLKNYRTSIKNLIVAVHSIAPSPKPTKTPEATSTATPVVTATP